MLERIGVSIAELNNMISNMRFWAFHCEKGGQGCYMAPTLYAAADALQKIKEILEETDVT